MTEAALQISGLAKRFGTKQVLTDVNLTVSVGSVTAVLGPSGGGKTTLLRIVAGFDAPDAGSVTIAGRDVVSGHGSGRESLPPERRHVGVVPQEGALFPHLSVGGNVGFGLSRQQRAGGRIGEMLELVGLQGTERMRPHELSGGQQHRVALARALAPRPAIVMLDEPFASLDAGLRAQVRAEVLDALRASNSTAVIVTHDQLEALSVADQVAVLLDGRIAQAAGPVEVYHRPATLEVATFVGEAVVVPGSFDGQTVDCALGRLVTATGSSTTAPGKVHVLLRPEQLTISDEPGDSGIPGIVIARQYFGHDAVVSVRVADGTVVTARLQTTRLPSTGAAVRVDVCDAVSVYSVNASVGDTGSALP